MLFLKEVSMKNVYVLVLIIIVVLTICLKPSYVIASPDNVVELQCTHLSGNSTNKQNEIDKITLDIKNQKVKLWMSKKDDGWKYTNDSSIPTDKKSASLIAFSDGVISGTGHNYYVSSAFQYSPKESRFLWVWIEGSGNIYKMEYNCREIKY
jgi:cell division protein FtsW (lipid II flippase)